MKVPLGHHRVGSLLVLASCAWTAAAFLPAPHTHAPVRTRIVTKGAVQDLVHTLFEGRGGAVDAAAVAAACAPSVVWNDRCASAPHEGNAAVESMMLTKFDAGSRLVVERVADGDQTGGFCWHREAVDMPGKIGLRGITYLELGDDGKIKKAIEGSEPLSKPGKITADLFAAVTKDLPKPAETYTPRETKGCSDFVRYIWNEAYPGGAKPDVALAMFSSDIRYEDFNYVEPFVGIADVKDMVTQYDLGGIEWILENASEGEKSTAFTWRIKVNGNEAADGVSFYDTNAEGKVDFIRDIPSPLITPAPAQALAALMRPKLRVFEPL